MSLDNSNNLFTYKNNSLHFSGHNLAEHHSLKNYKSPVLLYDLKIVQERLDWLKEWKGLGRLHFAMKSNYTEEVLKLILRNGCGVDVVSLGEIKLALKAGFKPQDVLFSGVAKTAYEIEWAIQNDVYQINVESASELKRIDQISQRLGKNIDVGLRLNPEVDAKTHPNIATALKDSKFGLYLNDLSEVEDILKSSKHIQLKALSFHIGSQVMDVTIFQEAIVRMKAIYSDFQKRYPSLDRFDLGGGLGINYKDHDISHDQKRWQDLKAVYEKELNGVKAFFLIEMGRFIVARSAVLVAQLQYIKKTENKLIAILDVGMNNLLRPMLYAAYHQVYPLQVRAKKQDYMVVGPLCESSDVFHQEITLSELQEGDLVAIADAGAYAKSMASNYNLQPIAEDYFL